jgi:hypothetical protein
VLARSHWHCTWWLIQQQNIRGAANITFITCLTLLCSNISISMELICYNFLCLSPTHLVWPYRAVDCVWNVMAHAQKPDFVFRRNGRVHLNRRGRQFSLLLAAEVCASAVVMLDAPCSEVVWRVLATDSIRQFPLHFPSRASPCAITFQLHSMPQSMRDGYTLHATE